MRSGRTVTAGEIRFSPQGASSPHGKKHPQVLDATTEPRLISTRGGVSNPVFDARRLLDQCKNWPS